MYIARPVGRFDLGQRRTVELGEDRDTVADVHDPGDRVAELGFEHSVDVHFLGLFPAPLGCVDLDDECVAGGADLVHGAELAAGAFQHLDDLEPDDVGHQLGDIHGSNL
ncbi:hypothetical protein ACWGID_16755 [Kribbella sp. NPDC054772]